MGLASAVFGLILFFCVIYNDMMELYDDEEKSTRRKNEAPISDEMQKQNQSAFINYVICIREERIVWMT